MAKKIKHSILEPEGLGAELWKGINAQAYVRKERIMGLVDELKGLRVCIDTASFIYFISAYRKVKRLSNE